ncbi:hypothetical protein RUM44_003600 [Polyplax serrata]|uniref:Uncharacterized protein n=1 Tax=Polyplax serrata TaxID=468196 RepID=A0ABR1AIK7_POLSC
MLERLEKCGSDKADWTHSKESEANTCQTSLLLMVDTTGKTPEHSSPTATMRQRRKGQDCRSSSAENIQQSEVPNQPGQTVHHKQNYSKLQAKVVVNENQTTVPPPTKYYNKRSHKNNYQKDYNKHLQHASANNNNNRPQ